MRMCTLAGNILHRPARDIAATMSLPEVYLHIKEYQAQRNEQYQALQALLGAK